MWPNSERRCSRCTTTIAASLFAVLLTVGEVQNLKCRTPDHWRRRGEFVDIAEQCGNATASGDRSSTASGSSSSSGQDDDYSSGGGGGNDRRIAGGNRRNAENGRRNGDGGGRRQNNREFSVLRQDYNGGDNNDRGDGGSGNRGHGGGGGGDRGGNRGYSGGYGGDRGGYGYGDRDSTSCDVRLPQQLQQYYPPGNNNGDRQRNHNQQGNSYYPSVDYEARQSNSNNRQSSMRRYRRDAVDANNNRNRNNRRRSKSAAATSSHRILGNNRFRNVTKNGGSASKGSILDKMDACTIHCVFNQLEMLNSNSRPDKASIVNIMTNQIKDVELKEFIQDSIDECFDTLELDSHNTKCEFSKNFAMCMENKAQRNCDDWDENASTNKNYGQDDGNSQQDKRKGY